MKCPHCGFEDEGNFCSNCGNPLQQVINTGRNIMMSSNKVDKLKGWHVSISFGKSSSPNFSKALAMAKAAPQYIESTDEKGKPIYQAIYGPEEYLSFISLYELISNWKSTFVFINGEMVDRKIIRAINYCYGDKLRSGNPNFCFGASEWTENPFGCHRAQIHRGKDAWYTFGIMDTKGRFHIDKDNLKNELLERLKPYRFCPALNIEEVMHKLNELPDIIDPTQNDEWEYTTYFKDNGVAFEGLRPKAHNMAYTINIKLNMDETAATAEQNNDSKLEEIKTIPSAKATKSTGCILPILVVLLILWVILR